MTANEKLKADIREMAKTVLGGRSDKSGTLQVSIDSILDQLTNGIVHVIESESLRKCEIYESVCMTKLEKIENLIELHEDQGEKLDQIKCHFLIEANLWSWELETRTKDMNLPKKRKRDLSWLKRNLVIRNQHPNARLAVVEVNRLLAARALETSESSLNT